MSDFELDTILEGAEEQRSQDWHALRLGRLTASTFDKLMTSESKPIEQAATAMAVIVEAAVEYVTGIRKDFENAATAHGTELEPVAIAAYEKAEGNEVAGTGFIPKEKFGGSPDGLVGTDGIIEVKCPYNPVNHAMTVLTGEVPKQYRFQVQGNLWVTGRKWCDFISYSEDFPDKSKLKVIRVERDEEMIERLVKRLHEAEGVKQSLIQKLM
jgi:putative phage-type endonuclease